MSSLNINITDEQVKELAKDIMLSMPEYSESLRCIKWDYKSGIFEFLDYLEDGSKEINKHIVTTNQIIKAIPKLWQGIIDKKWYFDLELDDFLDAGAYDAPVTDAIIQLAVFDDIIYG
jgi:hypothetical protein